MVPENPKLRSLAAAESWRDGHRAAGRRVVLTNGCFDLVHPGHVHFLQGCRALGDALVVALNSDASVRALKGPHRPILSTAHRAYVLAGLACVDCLVVFHAPRLGPEIHALRPDAYAKAGDYTRETLDPAERTALEAVGASFHFLPFMAGFSTTELIARVQAAGRV